MGSELKMLVDWYQVISSENSNWQDRTAATKSLEDAKLSMRVGCITAGLEICKQVGLNDSNQFIGLHLIEYGVLHYYSDEGNPQQRQQQVTSHREPFMAMVRDIVGKGATVSRMVVEKLAEIVSNFAKVDWPHYWPDLLQQLYSLGNNLITITSLRKILEDIKDSTHHNAKAWSRRGVLTPTRRKDMIDAVRSVATALVQFICEQLKGNLRGEEGLVAAEAILCLMELVDPSVLLTCEVDRLLVQIVTNELVSDTDSEVWQLSSKCLVECCSAITDASRLTILCVECSRMPLVLIDQLSSSRQLSTCGGYHNLLLCLAECVSASLRNGCMVRSPDFSQAVSMGSQSLIRLLEIPSIPLAEVVLSSLGVMIKNKAITEILIKTIMDMQASGKGDLIVLIRELLPNYVSDPEIEEGLQFPHVAFSEEAYGDHDTWQIAFDDCRRLAKRVLDQLFNSSQLRSVFGNSLLALISELKNNFMTPNAQDPRCSSSGELLQCSRQCVAWESTSFILSCCLIPTERYDELTMSALDPLTALLSCDSDDGVIVSQQASLASSIIPLLYSSKQLLVSVVSMLFSRMNHRRSYEVGSLVLSPITEDARKSVFACFVKLARNKNLLQDLVDQLLTSSGQLVSSGNLLATEVSLLYEGLVLVSNGLPTEQQQTILNMISSPVLSQLSELKELSTVQSLAKFVVSQPLQTMKRTHQIIATLTGMFRQSRHGAFAQLSEQLMEPVFTVAKALSQLYGPEGRAELPPSHQSIIVPKVFSGYHSWQNTDPDRACSPNDPDDCRDFLEELQNCIFELLGRIVSLSTAFHQHYATIQPGTISNNISISTMKGYLMHFALPFINSPFAYCGADKTPSLQHAENTVRFISGTCRMCGKKVSEWYGIESLQDEPDLREIAMMSIDVVAKFGCMSDVEKLLSTQPLSGSACLYLIVCSLGWETVGPAVKAMTIFNKKIAAAVVDVAELHPHLLVLFGVCLKKLLCQSSLSNDISKLIGSDCAQDKLMTECLNTITHLISSLPSTQVVCELLSKSGVNDASHLIASVLKDNSIPSRQALVRNALAKAVGQSCNTAVAFPMFKQPDNHSIFYTDEVTVPVEVMSG
eukprot:TRINITY_DN15335_c2_g1_i1.p1 TRINITY_DN15335_c2_g1~~TRINITY_DN15335_c2_g1_i1.p1  ORF type:complete len:1129 (+),score=171.80 TRINITY_DN15335_c2_g1_i1:89-3388(+)